MMEVKATVQVIRQTPKSNCLFISPDNLAQYIKHLKHLPSHKATEYNQNF